MGKTWKQESIRPSAITDEKSSVTGTAQQNNLEPRLSTVEATLNVPQSLLKSTNAAKNSFAYKYSDENI